MLEASGFDFRNRHPHELVVKLAKACGLQKDSSGKTAWDISLDLYRTFAPLKQTTQTMAIACVELAARLEGADLSPIIGYKGIDYQRWTTTRAEVMGTSLLFSPYTFLLLL